MTITRGADNDPHQIHDILCGFSGDTVFDVGGNIGDTARLLAARFGRVLSFEPADESYGYLAALGLANVQAHQLAVSDHDGAVTLTVQEHPIKSGQLTSAEVDDTAGWGKILSRRTVPCRTLDSLTEIHGAPDFIKIDVEGHEVQVVKGGLGTLETWRPDLYIEVHNDRLGQELRELLSEMYPDLERVQHPNYRPSDWGYDNHYWLLAR